MAKNAIKRILQKDMKSVEQQNLNSLGIYISFDEQDIRKAKAMIIGPKGSLYEGGYLFFNITFPNNYPWAPPDVSYVPRNRIRIHPNIYVGGHRNGGKVCLSILGTWSGPRWSSIMDISTVLLCIQSLLDTNPLRHEPGYENNISKLNTIYNEMITYNTVESLIYKNIKEIPQGFEEFQKPMIDYFQSHKVSLMDRIKEWEYIENTVCMVPFYKINHILFYQKTFRTVDELLLNTQT
jgi:ubiquitin-protein ligase